MMNIELLLSNDYTYLSTTKRLTHPGIINEPRIIRKFTKCLLISFLHDFTIYIEQGQQRELAAVWHEMERLKLVLE